MKHMKQKIKDSLSPGLQVTTLDILTLCVPGGVLSAIGFGLGYAASGFVAGLAAATILFAVWATMLISIGMHIVSRMGYIVVERFGKFRTVLFRGIGWVNPFFDHVKVPNGSLKIEQHQLFRDEDTRRAMDFTDGVTAPVAIKAAYGVGDPEDINERRWDRVTLDVREYTYRYADPKERIDVLLDGALRPRLQSLSSDAAQIETDKKCEEAATAVSPALAEIGVYLPVQGALVVEDIDLPEEVIRIREEGKRGEADAIAQQARLQAPANAILAVRDTLRAGEFQMSDERISDMLLAQQGLEAIGKTGANVSLFGFDVKSLLNSLGVGNKGG